MNSVVKDLLKNGIQGLAELDEEYFKANITDAIAFKLNESMKEVYKDTSSKLFVNEENTENSKNLNEFVNFIETFKEGRYQFKNKSVLNITESQMIAVKELFDSLSPKSRKIMVKDILEDSSSFKNHIEFYNQSKGLLK